MLTLLIEAGAAPTPRAILVALAYKETRPVARIDIRDTLWNGTPLGWAMHNGKSEAEAYLRALAVP